MSTKPPGMPNRPLAGSRARSSSSTRPSSRETITPAATAGLKWRWKPHEGQESTRSVDGHAGPVAAAWAVTERLGWLQRGPPLRCLSAARRRPVRDRNTRCARPPWARGRRGMIATEWPRSASKTPSPTARRARRRTTRTSRSGLFVPRARRPYVYALYAFARAADDFADEPIYEGVRREKLDDWERAARRRVPRRGRGADLRRARRDGAPLRDPEAAAARPALRLPPGHGEDALRVAGTSCSTTAAARPNPVGRLVLLVFEQQGDELPAAVGRHLHRPAAREPLAGRGHRLRARAASTCPRTCCAGTASPTGTSAGGRVSDGWRGLMGELIARTRELFERGRPLCDRVSPRAALRDAAHLARRDRRSSTASKPSGGDVFAPPAEALDRSTRPRSPGGPGAGRAA